MTTAPSTNSHWDLDTTAEVIGNHSGITNDDRCTVCHIYSDVPYTNAGWLTTFHGNDQIDLNVSLGYTRTAIGTTPGYGCADNYHFEPDNANHNLERSGWPLRLTTGPGACVAVRSFAEFHEVFVGLWQPSPLSYAVEQYFDNGGQKAVIVRVVNGGAPATITLPCGVEALTLEALSPGTRESLRASVDYDNIGANEPDRFNLVVQRVRSRGSEHIEDQEIFRRVSVVPDTTRFVARRCRNHSWCGCGDRCPPRARSALSAPARAIRSATSIPTPTATTARHSPTTT